MTRWMLPALALLLGATLLPVTAQAQVAVPGFSPAAVTVLEPGGAFPARANFTTPNPAAMQWGAPSRVGLGVMDGTLTSKTSDETADISGRFGGVRLVGERLSFAAQNTVQQSDSNVFDFSEDGTELGVAGALAEFLTLGLNVTQQRRDYGSEKQEFETRSAGIGLGFNEFLYLGYAIEEQDLKVTLSGDTSDFERSGTMYGVGLRSGGGDLLWHLEVYRVIRENFDDPTLGTFLGRDRSAAVLEVNWRDILLGYGQSEVDYLDGKTTTSASHVELGWAPQEGFAITGRIERAERDDGTDTVTESDIASVAVAVSF